MTQIFEVYQIDGNSGQKLHWTSVFFVSEQEAKKYVGSLRFPSNAEIEPIDLHMTAEPVIKADLEKLCKQAIGKLSSDEIRALGLDK